jgi:hypothetical protein
LITVSIKYNPLNHYTSPSGFLPAPFVLLGFPAFAHHLAEQSKAGFALLALFGSGC